MNLYTRSLLLFLLSLTPTWVFSQNNPKELIVIRAGSAVVKPAETVCIDISGTGMSPVAGMQFSITWDPTVVEFVEVKNLNLPGLSLNDFGLSGTGRGILTFLYLVPPTSVLKSEENFFSLCFRGKDAAGKSSPILITDRPTDIEFVGEIANNFDVINVYSMIGGNITIPGANGPSTPLAINAAAGATNCIVGGSTELRVEAVGGQGPYNYSWTGPENFQAATQSITVNRPGAYFARATDALGHQAEARMRVDSSTLRLLDAVIANTSCSNSTDGSINLGATGGAGARSFRWSNGANSAVINNLAAGTYRLTVSDELGCAVVREFEVKAGPGVSLNPEVKAPACGRSDGSIRLNAASPAGGLSYSWSGGATTAERNDLGPGAYSVTVTDARGCKAEQQFVFPDLALNLSVTSECGPDPNNTIRYFAIATAGGGNGNYRFRWSSGQIDEQAASSRIGLPGAGQYSVTVTDTMGCAAERSFEVPLCGAENPVWPGDANTDGRVDHLDLLHVGLAFGRQGTAREQGSTNWQAQASFPWNGSTPQSKINFKYADTDGNGRVEAADTSAILLNWGRNAGNPGIQEESLEPRNAGIPIFVEEAPALAGQEVSFNIVLGDPITPASGVYGLAFTIAYDSLVVDAEKVRIRFADSWMGALQTDLLTLQRNRSGTFRIDAALSRINQQGASGQGVIAQLRLPLKSELPGGGNSYDMQFRLENVRLISPGEQALELTAIPTTVVVEKTLSRFDPVLDRLVQVSPNPARDVLQISAPESFQVQRATLFYLNGQQVMNWQEKTTLELPALAPGLYWLRLEDGKGKMVVKKVVVK